MPHQKKNNVKTVNLKFEIEEGDLMDQNFTLTIFEDLLKVNASPWNIWYRKRIKDIWTS